MKTVSTHFLDAEHLKAFITQHQLDSREGVLVQIFSGICNKEYLDIIRLSLLDNLKNPVIIGSTTDGEIYKTRAYTSSVTIAFTSFENSSVFSSYVPYSECSFEMGQKLASDLITQRSKVLITFADGLKTNGERYLEGITQHSRSVVVSGGLSGDNAEFFKTYVIDNNGVYQEGAVGAVIEGESLHVKSDFSFGWKPVGHTFTITSSHNNRVYKVDDMTPRELYAKYLGDEVASKLPSVGIEFPFIIHADDGSISARAVIEAHDDGSLTFAGNIYENSVISIGFGDINNIQESTSGCAQNLAYENIETLFAYSCMARRRFLQNNVDNELKFFDRDIDINGFFTYGEFYSKTFCNETLTMLAMSEKPLVKKKTLTQENSYDNSSTIQALSNLITQTTKELNESNFKLQNKIDEKSLELININASLENQLYTNHVTRLPNRLALKKALADMKFYGLLMIDIKDFQNINDLFGNDIGDVTLKSFGEFLYYFAREQNWGVFNLSGDEFVLLSYSEHTVEFCEYLANKLISNLDGINSDVLREKIGVDVNINVTISIACNIDNPIEHAHMAMVYAKNNHKQIVIYSDELKLEKRYEDDIKWSKVVVDAIKDDKIVPFYQPILSKDGSIKYEALMRIIDDGKVYAPFFFLDIAKKIGKYAQLTKIMIKKVFTEFEHKEEKVSINLSYQDIINEEIIDYIIQMLQEKNIADRIIFEIVESENIENFPSVVSFVELMHKMGAKIAIDDFGSGYSNYIHVLQLKPDIVKIDGSLIKDIDKDENSYILTKNMYDFAANLEIESVAEFVHSESIFKIVKEMGITSYQGYLIGEPKQFPTKPDFLLD